MSEAPKKHSDTDADTDKETASPNGKAAKAVDGDSSTAAETAAETGAETGATAEEALSPEATRIADLEEEVAQLKDRHMRALAEAENIRRRAQREREDTAKYATSSLARELLPVADSLRLALDAVPKDVSEDAPDGGDIVRNLAAGVEATERQLLAAFERAGIRKIDPRGEPFDPNFHQAVMEVETTDQPPGTVAQVFQPGYVIHDRILRAAMVSVAKRPAASPPVSATPDPDGGE